jgi:predicted nucleic acid-binding protein
LKALFIDSSAIMAVLLEEPPAREMREVLRRYEPVFASGLLEAEVRSASYREKVEDERVEAALACVNWLTLERSLAPEIARVLATGIFLRGADLWHVACALYLAGNPSQLPFLTLDHHQAEAAGRLGFKVLPISMRFHDGARIEEPGVSYRIGKTSKPSRVENVATRKSRRAVEVGEEKTVSASKTLKMHWKK